LTVYNIIMNLSRDSGNIYMHIVLLC